MAVSVCLPEYLCVTNDQFRVLEEISGNRSPSSSKTGSSKADDLLAAALSAFATIMRPGRQDMQQLEDLAMPLLQCASTRGKAPCRQCAGTSGRSAAASCSRTCQRAGRNFRAASVAFSPFAPQRPCRYYRQKRHRPCARHSPATVGRCFAARRAAQFRRRCNRPHVGASGKPCQY